MASRQSRKNSVGRYQAGQAGSARFQPRYPVGLDQVAFVSGPAEGFATTSAITKSGCVRVAESTVCGPESRSGPLRAEHASFASAPFGTQAVSCYSGALRSGTIGTTILGRDTMSFRFFSRSKLIEPQFTLMLPLPLTGGGDIMDYIMTLLVLCFVSAVLLGVV
jgi:hypothetical protein